MKSVCESDQQATNTGIRWRLIFPRLHDMSNISHTYTHGSLSLSQTSHHQDLDFVLFVGPVEEGDAGVLPEERG